MEARAPALMPAMVEPRDALLRRALAGNALFSAVSGAVMILGSRRISDFTGLSPAWAPAAIGAAVLCWAVAVALLARSAELRPALVRLVIAGDLAWVTASYAVLIAGEPSLTAAGVWSVGILAEIVALFGIVQYLGLRRLRAERGVASYR